MSERSDANRLDVDGLPGDRSARRRAALLSGLRSLAGAVVLLIPYVFVPVPGDITANSNEARILVTLQMLFDLALIAGLVRLVILATRAGLRRRGVGSELVDRDGL